MEHSCILSNFSCRLFLTVFDFRCNSKVYSTFSWTSVEDLTFSLPLNNLSKKILVSLVFLASINDLTLPHLSGCI